MKDPADFLSGPALPAWFLFPVTALFAAVAIYVIARTPGRAGRFLLFACWFRYTLSSLHEYTYREAFAGLSWIALGSILTIVTGLVLLDKKRFLTKALFPIAAICGSIVLSAIINEDPAASIEPVLRFAFFAVVCVAMWQSLETAGSTILPRLLVVFIPPIIEQLGSIALGVAKSGEMDGSLSFIGGFFHEQPFSLILATCFLVVIFASSMGRLMRIGLSLVSLGGVYLANYRTTILAFTPLAGIALFLMVPRAFRTKQRSIGMLAVLIFASAFIALTSSATQNRFSDLQTVATTGTRLIKPPEAFSSSERQILSKRPYIWSWYLYAYVKAPPVQRAVGFGPDAWVGKFPQYAHNTLVSFLYEMGLVGVAAILLLWGTMFRLALLAEPPTRGLLIAAHASFFVLNMATMPHWQIEGNILYGVLCGYTLAKARLAKARSTAEQRDLRAARHGRLRPASTAPA
jgi:hypothetical protein